MLSQWAGINQHKSTEICVDTVIYTQVCITGYQGSRRTKAAVVHEWLQKQTIEAVGIYQKFAPNKGNMKPNPDSSKFGSAIIECMSYTRALKTFLTENQRFS